MPASDMTIALTQLVDSNIAYKTYLANNGNDGSPEFIELRDNFNAACANYDTKFDEHVSAL